MNSTMIYDPMINLVHSPASLFTLMLFALWVCSPVGGQSSLRLVHRSNITTTSITPLVYPDTGLVGQMTLPFQYSGRGGLGVTMRDAFSSALTQTVSVKKAPVDIWGNVKIPRLDILKNYTSPDKDGWYDVSQLPKAVESWSSLFGLPIVGGLDQFNQQKLHFNVQSSYIEMACTDTMQGHNTDDYVFSVQPLVCDPTLTVLNYTLDPFVERSGNSSDAIKLCQRNAKTYVFQANIYRRFANIWHCLASQRFVETAIECKYGVFTANKTRPLRNIPGGENSTLLDNLTGGPLPLLEDSSTLAQGQNSICQSAAASFLQDPNTNPVRITTGASILFQGTKDYNFSSADLDLRVPVLMNTLAQSWFTPTAPFGELPKVNRDFYGPVRTPSDPVPGFVGDNVTEYWPNELSPFIGAFTNATLETDHEVFNPTYSWCVLLIVSSTALISLGLVGIYCQCRSLAPNMFDPVMGWTYMNPYIPPPPLDKNGEYPLSIEKRMGALRKLKIRLGSVNGSNRLIQPQEESIPPSEPKQRPMQELDLSSAAIALGAFDRVERLRRRGNGFPSSKDGLMETAL